MPRCRPGGGHRRNRTATAQRSTFPRRLSPHLPGSFTNDKPFPGLRVLERLVSALTPRPAGVSALWRPPGHQDAEMLGRARSGVGEPSAQVDFTGTNSFRPPAPLVCGDNAGDECLKLNRLRGGLRLMATRTTRQLVRPTDSADWTGSTRSLFATPLWAAVVEVG